VCPQLRRPGFDRPFGLSLRDQALERQAEVARRLAALVVQQRAVALEKEHLCHRRLPRRRGDQGPPQRRELVARAARRRVRLLDQLRGPARAAAVQVVQELLLALEVPVDRALRHTRLLRDLGRRRHVIALGGEQLEGGAHQPLVREVGLRHRARI